MKAFVRDNPTIAFGLGLPVLLAALFLLVSGLPALFVDPPTHDLLFATEYYNDQEGVQIFVMDQKVQVTYRGAAQVGQVPRLWRYHAKNGAIQELPLVLPPALTAFDKTAFTAGSVRVITPIAVPDLEGLVVDSASIAPDGYEFVTGSDRYTRNVFGGLFYPSRYRHEATLTKNGRSVRLPRVDDNYYRRQTRFIGWVIAQ